MNSTYQTIGFIKNILALNMCLHDIDDYTEDFKIFLEQNPSVRHLEVRATFVLKNKDSLMTTNSCINSEEFKFNCCCSEWSSSSKHLQMLKKKHLRFQLQSFDFNFLNCLQLREFNAPKYFPEPWRKPKGIFRSHGENLKVFQCYEMKMIGIFECACKESQKCENEEAFS